MATERLVARATYQNGGFGEQSKELFYAPGSSAPWTVVAWDRWAHRTLAEARAHYRRIGASPALAQEA